MDEISSEMHKSAKAGDVTRVNVLGDEMCKILGDEHSIIKTQIMVLYNMPI